MRGAKALGKLTAAGVATGAALASAFGALGVKEAIEQEKVAARTANVLKTTGGVANVTKRQIEGLSSALQDQTGVADDTIQSSQNLLLTFTKVRNEAGKGNDIFTQGTKAALDMSSALGTDLQGATLQIGKALNDPVKGMTALSRAGVSFTQQQRDQVKAMVESGDVLGAQKVILSELQTQFGGAAEAAGNTTAGQFEKLKRTTEDAAESVAVSLLPVLTDVASFMRTEVVPRAAEVVDAFQRHWPTIKAVAVEVFGSTRAAVQVAIEWIRANVVPTIRAVVAGAQAFWRQFGGTITAVFKDVVVVVRSALNVVRGIVETVLAVIRGDWGAAWNGIKTIVSGVWTGVMAIVRAAGRLLLRVMGEVAGAALSAFLAPFKKIGGLLRSAFVSGVRGVGDLATFMLSRGRDWGGKLVDGIVAAIKSVGGRIKDAILAAIPDSISIGPVDIPLGNPFAGGGFTPGRYTGRDPYVARVDGNEAILNPTQQAMVPGGRSTLVDIFRRTGGRTGGGSFARGGMVGAAYSRAVGKLGTEYKYGKWDCADFAYYAAGMSPWGSTASAIGDSGPATGDEPVLWGLRKSHGGAGWIGGRKEHMGIGIIDPSTGKRRWFDNGSGGVESNADSARWQLLRVPKPFVGLSADDLDTGSATRGAPGLTAFQEIKRAFTRAGVAAKKAGPMATRALSALGAGVTGTSDRLAGGSLTGAESRSVSAAGRSARSKARGLGKSPQDVAKAGEDAERAATVKFYRLHIRQIDAARRKLGKQKARLLADLKALPGKKSANRKAAAKRINVARATIDAELRELLELRAEANEQLAQLNEAAVEDQHAENYGDGPGEPATELDNLEAAVAVAQLTDGTDDDLAAARAVEDYRRREYAAAVASGDPRLIRDAANALVAAQQNREQIEALRANTDAVNANTEAVRSMGGSLTFGYRGQDYVLRSLAPPSSDRLDASLLGV